MEEKIKIIKELIDREYNSYSVNWTSERSCGNYDDCFDDGYESGCSNTLYQIGQILEMDLEYPDDDEDDSE